MTFGLTTQGFNRKRLPDIKASQENALIAEFGEVNLVAQSVFGQFVGVESKQDADIWEQLEAVYFSQYPNTAEGVSLDYVVALNGITRLPQARTRVVGVSEGIESTLIPEGSIAVQPETDQTFFAEEDTFISSSRAVESLVNIETLAAQVYTIIINSNSFFFSLPIITFSAAFEAGDEVFVTINGVTLSGVPFNTDNNQTLADVATAIQGTSAVATATPTNPDVIEVVPALGSQVNISVLVTGTTAPTAAITFDTPASKNQVTQYLTAVINASSLAINATDNADDTLSIFSDDSEVPYSISVVSGLSIDLVKSPVIFLASSFGVIPAPIGSLTEIQTPIAGWESITNLKAGVTGRETETDAELRLRRQNSIKLLGLATVESIRSRLLQQVDGVTQALVIENRTMQEEDIEIIFASDLITGNEITLTVNGVAQSPIIFASSHDNTMDLLAAQLNALPDIQNASKGGTGNRTLTVVINQGYRVTISVNITDGASQTSHVKEGGRFPKSFEAIVQGGNNLDIANKLWETKPAGIETFGTEHVLITDSMGFQQAINFSRPNPIYIWITIILTLNTEETFPANGIDLVKQAFKDYGDSLLIGDDVLFQRILCQIFDVSGVARGNLQIAQTLSPTDSPSGSYGTSDITIADTDLALFDTVRMTVTIT